MSVVNVDSTSAIVKQELCLPGDLELLILLDDAALALLLDLGDLELGADDLGLLSLEVGLGLLQSDAELVLFEFEPLDKFLQLVDALAALAELIGEVLDLIYYGGGKRI